MSLAVRNRTTPFNSLPPLPGLRVERIDDARVMARLQNRTEAAMQERFDDGHRAYVAFVDSEAAAWGWVATRSAHIGELGAAFTLPARTRYLWNFVTAPAQRGKGIYPRLLDAIVRAESSAADRFWIAYAPENHASAAGIHKAGFETVARLSFDEQGGPAVIGIDNSAGRAAADLLGLPQAATPLSQCWRCARATTTASCRTGSCCCDYQQPLITCA